MEPFILTQAGRGGWIEVICGSMFSGKTEELIRRLRRARIARQRVEIFKPAIETRYHEDAVVSHDENAIHSTPIHAAPQILLMVGDATVIGVDEAQFFDLDLVEVCEQLAAAGKRVIVAGLDQDYLGRPFEPVPQLMAIAEHVTKLHAICVVCGAPANHSQRLGTSAERVMVGAGEAYEPRCRNCFEPAPIPPPSDEAPSPPRKAATPSQPSTSPSSTSDQVAPDQTRRPDRIRAEEQAAPNGRAAADHEPTERSLRTS